MDKELKRQIKEALDIQLIFWIQDINRLGGDAKYSKEFQKTVHSEIIKRGEKSIKE